MKKIFISILVLLINFITVAPVLAEMNENQKQDSPVLMATVED